MIDCGSVGIISGQIEIESDYSTTYYSPLLSITENVTDSLGFNWQFGRSTTTATSTNTHSYTHQDTTVTFSITFEYKSPVYHNGEFQVYYDAIAEYGMHTHPNVNLTEGTLFMNLSRIKRLFPVFIL